MNANIIPVGARLLGSIPKRGKSASGLLHLPETAQQDQSMLTVVRLGEKAPEFDVEPGDTICIAKGLMLNETADVAYFVVNYEDVLAIMRD